MGSVIWSIQNIIIYSINSMRQFLFFLLGIFLINSIFSLIPIMFPSIDLSLYLPYQFWFNAILLFAWLLPQRLAKYLFDKRLQILNSEK